MSGYKTEYTKLPYKTIQDVAKALGITRQYAFMTMLKQSTENKIKIYSLSNACLCVTDKDFIKLISNYEAKRKKSTSKKVTKSTKESKSKA